MGTRTEDLALLRQVNDKLQQIEYKAKAISTKQSQLNELRDECEEPFPYHEFPTDSESSLYRTLKQECNALREKEWKTKKRTAKWIVWFSVLINLALVTFSCFWLYTNAWGMEIKILNESLGTEYFIVTVLSGICVALIPRINPFFIFHRSKSKDESKKSNNPWLIVLILASIEPYFIYLLLHLLFPLVTLQKGVTAVTLVLIVAVTVISRILSKKLSREPAPIDYEYISNRYSTQLQKAAEQDEKNEKINESNRIAALKKKQDEYQPKIDACQEELDMLRQEKAELTRELSTMDCLGSKDKNVETVAFLIYQLENHRADSIKEALQQYDANRKPKTVYSGEAWDLTADPLSASEVIALENDLYDLLEVMANTRDEEKLVNNWFGKLCLQFSLGCVSSDPSEKAKNDVITRNMREPNSWYLNVAGLLQGYVGTNIVMSMFSGHVSYLKEFPEALAQSEFRGAVTDRERQFVANATVVMKRLTDALYDRMRRKMS